MRTRGLLASSLVACLLTVALIGIAPAANAEPAGRSPFKAGKSAKNNAIKLRRSDRGPRIYLPRGPGSVYYDYPYYYCRGYYPTHIVGYIYYPSPYRCRYDWGYNRSPGSARRLRAHEN